jgi:hypothetical protein
MGKERSFEADAAALRSNQGLSVQATRLDQWRNVFFGTSRIVNVRLVPDGTIVTISAQAGIKGRNR